MRSSDSPLKVAVIGLGKLGLAFSTSLAHRGFQVTGVDVSAERVKAVNTASVDDVEPGLQEMLQQESQNIRATTDISNVAGDNDAIFIFVNTPGETSGKFATNDVLVVAREIGAQIKETNNPALIVLVSSVTPGSIDQEIIPVLEEASGKKNGQGFHFCYSPVFIALGTMMRDYIEPDMALIGEASPEAGATLESMLRKLYTRNDIPIVRTNYMNAELIKLCLSTFITTKITYANMIAALCDSLPAADADVVSHAIGLDSRVSPKVLKGGMPYGGPCFPRDNRALLYVLQNAGVPEQLVTATDTFNTELIDSFAGRLADAVERDGTIGVLGLSFKPKTHVVEESASLTLVNKLIERGLSVTVYDPEGMELAKQNLLPGVQFAGSDIECVLKSDVIAIATPWVEFADLPQKISQTKIQSLTIFDPWRMFNTEDFPAPVRYLPWGKSQSANHPSYETVSDAKQDNSNSTR